MDKSAKGTNGAGQVVARGTVSNEFTTDRIFLVCPFKNCKGDTVQCGKRDGGSGVSLSVGMEVDVAKSKGGFVIVRFVRAGVFTGAAEEVEAKSTEVRNMLVKGVGGSIGCFQEINDEGDWDRLDSGGGRIMFPVGFELFLKADV